MVARLVSKPTNTLKALKTKLKSPALIDSAGFLFELVVHSGKWTTGSAKKQGLGQISEDSGVASGPLWKVDH